MNTWTDRVISHERVALSPQGDIVLMVSLQKSSYTISNTRVYGGYYQRDHGIEVQTNGTAVYFINRVTGGVRPWNQFGYDLRSLAFSADGRTLMFEKYNQLYSDQVTPEGRFVSNFGTCHAGIP